MTTLRDVGQQANQLEDELGLTIDDVLNKLTQELDEFNDDFRRGKRCIGRRWESKVSPTQNKVTKYLK